MDAFKTIKKDHSSIDAILEKNLIQGKDELNADLIKWKNQCVEEALKNSYKRQFKGKD